MVVETKNQEAIEKLTVKKREAYYRPINYNGWLCKQAENNFLLLRLWSKCVGIGFYVVSISKSKYMLVSASEAKRNLYNLFYRE